MIFNMTGGGASLNFQVKTYPSETELKADKPKENTNGVITTTTMTSWVFSAKEPTEPEVGMVWIALGDSSAVEFNALKNNTLQVYPISAKQYEGGKWVGKTAFSYQDGEWTDWWNGQLYDSGNEWEHITGGWASKPFRIDKSSDYTPKAYPITKESDHILLSANMTENTSMIICHETPIDLTEWTSISIEFEYTGNQTAARLQVCSTNLDGTQIAGVDLKQGGTSCTLDISKVSGKYIVGVPIWAIYTSTINFKLKIILMK